VPMTEQMSALADQRFLRDFAGPLGLLSVVTVGAKPDIMGAVALRREEMTSWRKQR
jgi:hypothetical protein